MTKRPRDTYAKILEFAKARETFTRQDIAHLGKHVARCCHHLVENGELKIVIEGKGGRHNHSPAHYAYVKL